MLLGLIQGLTEFLPVSSSGHLVVFQHLFGLTEPQLLLDVMLHLGTLFAVCVVFRRDLWVMLCDIKTAIFGPRTDDEPSRTPGLRLFWLVVVATIPTGVMGLAFKSRIETLFGSPQFVGVAFLATGAILWASRYARRTVRDIQQTTVVDALLVGVSQGVAITPGISRSGTTISVGLLLGLDRALAARFSFLMAIPAIAGAAALQLRDAASAPAEAWLAILAGAVMAALSGYIALKILLRIVIAGNLSSFAYYCWGIGIATLAGTMYG